MAQRGFLIEIATGDLIKATIHDTAIDRVKYPADEFEFIPDDDSDPRVAALRDERDAPQPPGKKQVNGSLIWRIWRSKGIVADSDLPADVEPPEAAGA